jgi:hypothetical protein
LEIAAKPQEDRLSALSRLEQKIIDKSYDLLDIHTSKFRHYTFLARRNKILGIYINNPFKTHSISKRFGFRWSTLHSETQMIAATNFIFRNEYPRLKIYNVRVNNKDEISSSHPCCNCEVMLRSFGFRDVYYTDNDGIFHHWDD